ncbi:MAG: hypothetical protein ACHQ53_05425 [Polyangiales bacterium]
MAAALALWGCGGSTAGRNSVAVPSCVVGSAVSCTCSDNRTLTAMCLPSGMGYELCPCGALPGTSGTGGTAQAPQSSGLGTGGTVAAMGTGGAMMLATGGARAPGTGGTGGMSGTGGAGGLSGSGGMVAGTGGMSMTGGTGGGTAGAGANISGLPDAELDMLRQTCVDDINMYRATLMLTPLKRASAAQEACSDMGAQMDGDSGVAHQSARAGLCRSVGLGAEDACPGWGVGGFTGNATVADALKNCLMGMWAEGPPPSGTTVAQCIMDTAGCFQQHGHWINMSSSTSGVVACAFYKMKTGAYWMNQDFAQ